MVNWDSGLFRFSPVWGLTYLTLVNTVIYMDRSIVGVRFTQAVVHYLTDSSGMDLSSQEAGALGSVFILGYMFSSPVMAVSAQYVHPLFLMGIGLLVWSGAAIMAGLSVDYPMLIIARALSGVGEASFICLAPPYILDVAPPPKKTVSSRQVWISIFYAAMIIGAALGFVYGQYVAWGLGSWRWPFLIEGVLMLPLLSLSFLAYKDPVFRPKKLEGGDEKTTLWQQLRALFGLRVFVLISLGYGGYAFTVGGLNFWAPDYQEHFYKIRASVAVVVLGGITVLCGFAGTFVGAVVMDRRLKPAQRSFDEGQITNQELLNKRTEGSMGILWMSIGSAGAIALVGALIPLYPVYLVTLALSEFCIFL